MAWEIDGVALSTLAFNVVNRAAGWKVPAKRGENLVIPGRHGAQWLPNKPFEQGSISFSMWALGATEDGLVPQDYDSAQQCRDNLDKLTSLFAQSHKLLNVVQITGKAYSGSNEALNPGWEASVQDISGGTAAVSYKNFFRNPALRNTATSSRVTQNLFTNPRMLTAESSSFAYWLLYENLAPD